MYPRAYQTRTICSPLRPLRTQRGSLREPTSRCRLPHLSRPADPCPWSADVVCWRQARPCSRSGPIEGMLCRPLFYYNSNTNNAFPSPSPPPTTSGSTLPCDRWNSASPYSAVQPRVYMTNNNDSHKLKFLSCNSTTKNRPSYRLVIAVVLLEIQTPICLFVCLLLRHPPNNLARICNILVSSSVQHYILYLFTSWPDT